MKSRSPEPTLAEDQGSFFLPDFCEARTVLAIVLIAALLAFVLALARHSVHGAFWTELARTSAYLLWAGLLCSAVLCKARTGLARLPTRRAAAAALGLMLATVALISELVYWFGRVWADRLGTTSELFPSEHWSFLLPNLLIAGIVGSLALRYFYVANQWKRSVELEARARVKALQARIRPHFLFNSMNTIAALTRSDPSRAEEAIEDLSDLFRVSLSEARAQITMREELEVARIYQRIEQLRLGDRLRVNWRVGQLPASAIVPSLLLQPLLENAIGHGIEPLADGGTVEVTGGIDGDMLYLEVANPRAAAPGKSRTGHRMAMENIRQRLDLVFPGQSSVEIEETADHYRVRLRFPLVRGKPGVAPFQAVTG
jgi:two-component system sensor histidine kinase AlgZ